MRGLAKLVLCTGALGAGACAHDPGLSSCVVTLGGGRTELVLTLANADAARLFPGLDAGAVRSRLAPWLEVVALSVALEKNGDLRVDVTLPAARELRLCARWIDDLPRGHREYFVARDAAGNVLREALLQRGACEVAVAAAADAEPAGGPSFVLLGIEHVLTGYDHVLFLLALLVVTSRLGAALKIITSFTLAHSLTLALATLQVVRVPSSLVEVVIALSIVWVGVENLAVRQPRARWALTFCFGLVHGFGFATALQELGIAGGAGGVVVPLVGFNVGVELGQLAVAVVALPALAWVRRREVAARWMRVIASVAVVGAGAWWAVERVVS